MNLFCDSTVNKNTEVILIEYLSFFKEQEESWYQKKPKDGQYVAVQIHMY